MHENLFKHINIPKQNIYIPSGTTDNYEAFCQWYERRIVECGGIDLQILGIGSTATSPSTSPPVRWARGPASRRWPSRPIDDNARFFDSPEQVPIYAITMGVGTILEARKIVLLANGPEEGGGRGGQAIEGPVTSMITASALQLHRDVHGDHRPRGGRRT